MYTLMELEKLALLTALLVIVIAVVAAVWVSRQTISLLPVSAATADDGSLTVVATAYPGAPAFTAKNGPANWNGNKMLIRSKTSGNLLVTIASVTTSPAGVLAAPASSSASTSYPETYTITVSSVPDSARAFAFGAGTATRHPDTIIVYPAMSF